MNRTSDFSRFLGRAPESLTIPELRQLHGIWLAYEIYTPQTTPLKRIAAAGSSIGDCAAQLSKQGRDPLLHEYQLLRSPL